MDRYISKNLRQNAFSRIFTARRYASAVCMLSSWRASVRPMWHIAPAGPFISVRQDIPRCVRRCDVIHCLRHVLGSARLSHWSVVFYFVLGGSCGLGCLLRCVFSRLHWWHTAVHLFQSQWNRVISRPAWAVTSLSHWSSTSVYNTVGVRHRVARVCQRQRRLVFYACAEL